jgi:hypothetical protein
MARAKGSPKYGGRQPGSRNRTTSELQQALLKLLDDNLEALQTDLNSIKGKDRATLLISLAKHCTPPALNPERLTEEQLLQIIQYIKDNEKPT